jgi:hypothetical protein
MSLFPFISLGVFTNIFIGYEGELWRKADWLHGSGFCLSLLWISFQRNSLSIFTNTRHCPAFFFRHSLTFSFRKKTYCYRPIFEVVSWRLIFWIKFCLLIIFSSCMLHASPFSSAEWHSWVVGTSESSLIVFPVTVLFERECGSNISLLMTVRRCYFCYLPCITWTTLHATPFFCRFVRDQHAKRVTHCVNLPIWLEGNCVRYFVLLSLILYIPLFSFLLFNGFFYFPLFLYLSTFSFCISLLCLCLLECTLHYPE